MAEPMDEKCLQLPLEVMNDPRYYRVGLDRMGDRARGPTEDRVERREEVEDWVDKQRTEIFHTEQSSVGHLRPQILEHHLGLVDC